MKKFRLIGLVLMGILACTKLNGIEHYIMSGVIVAISYLCGYIERILEE